MSNNANGRSSASDDAARIVILAAPRDSCEGRPAPLLPALPAAARIAPSFSVPSAFLRVLCVKSFALLSAARPQNRQFLFRTNGPFSRSENFATHTKHSTSYFQFDTNERSRITTQQSLITTHELPKSAANLVPATPCRLTPPSRLRTMRRRRQEPCLGAHPEI
jgi:hypothetical protein